MGSYETSSTFFKISTAVSCANKIFVAILINALSVALGFAVLIFASVIPLQRFGILILLTMFLSSGATLILLPAIILTTKPKFLKKMLCETEVEKVKTNA